jgi:hypothetical protein
MKMPWLQILEMVLSLIAECRERKSRKTMRNHIQSGGRFERLVLRMRVRQAGGDSNDIEAANSMLVSCQGCTNEEADSIILAAEADAPAGTTFVSGE